MLYETRHDDWGPVTRATYRREPYIHITLPDGSTADGKASAWTHDKVRAISGR